MSVARQGGQRLMVGEAAASVPVFIILFCPLWCGLEIPPNKMCLKTLPRGSSQPGQGKAGSVLGLPVFLPGPFLSPCQAFPGPGPAAWGLVQPLPRPDFRGTQSPDPSPQESRLQTWDHSSHPPNAAPPALPAPIPVHRQLGAFSRQLNSPLLSVLPRTQAGQGCCGSVLWSPMGAPGPREKAMAVDRSILCISGDLASPTHTRKATHSPKSLGQPAKVCPQHRELPHSCFLVFQILVFQRHLPNVSCRQRAHAWSDKRQRGAAGVLSTPPAPHQDQAGGWT